ncbi:hypothetical protein [Methylomonas albis]|uniref:Uncharacterized protein n=1 Tax=Methylomonas albis TaxID=1854563 RepID=A0ABR9D4E2_9GAMM|nr:hypothetical protein [Methylomonas albis]MBD9357987.1 hypothetical protein [Methylomonas albis]
MNSIEPKLVKLKGHLESAAFMVSKGALEKEAHSEIVQSLVILSEIEGMLANPMEVEVYKKSDMREINKVNRRLKLWAKRQNQINSKILNAFLKLERSGVTTITETDIRNELPEEKSFESNFVQMKIIAEKNHGKIFEQYGDNIALWNPVIAGVREYENLVFEKAVRRNS